MLILDESHYCAISLMVDDGEEGVCKSCKTVKQLYHFTADQDYSVQVLCCKSCQQRSNREERADLEKEIAENEEYMRESEEE